MALNDHRHGGRFGRLEEGREDDFERREHINDPHLFAALDEEKAEDQQAAQHVGPDHNRFAVEAVGDDAGQGADEELRQQLDDEHEADGFA